MSFNHINASTTTSAHPIFIADDVLSPQTPITVYNGHSASIFIGDKSITTSGATIGRTLASGASQTFYVNSNDVVYAISAAASAAGAISITYSA
jgi:hypothetical protein